MHGRERSRTASTSPVGRDRTKRGAPRQTTSRCYTQRRKLSCTLLLTHTGTYEHNLPFIKATKRLQSPLVLRRFQKPSHQDNWPD